ncbi:MAG: hypothetical protein WC058_06490 [Phycisphaeraceae bacterium]
MTIDWDERARPIRPAVFCATGPIHHAMPGTKSRMAEGFAR